ncbi:MAG: heat-inducible transcriptional repressor HrcA [Dehalococcoidales bacterium]|nr:heat-inducible transcriptional repressor HrcA [Dehalococcoidales bacterium]
MSELSERQCSILKVIVAEHVTSAQPVGSDGVARKLQFAISPATVRNEMAELEESGYLHHPHTSAGRLPTDKGYRYFVEWLLEERELALDTRKSIRQRFQSKASVLEDWIDLAAEVLATAAENAALVSAPYSPENRLKHLEIVCVQDRLALLVVVLQDSTLRQQFLPFEETVTQDEASAMANHLNARFGGFSLAQLQTSDEPLSGLEMQVMDALLKIMRQVDERRYWDIHYDGLGYMLSQPEFERAEKLRQVFDLLGEKRTLAQLMVGAALDDRPRIIIGGEDNNAFPLRECSLVLGRYGGEGETSGFLAVLGPIRMEYDRAVSSVRYMATVLNEMLAELYGWQL